MRRDGLSESDFSVLVTLLEADEQRRRFGDLRTELGWTKSRLSRQLTRMESRTLIAKQNLDTDGRAVVVILTQTGRDVILAATPAHYQDVRRWFLDSLTPAQLKTIVEVSSAVLARLPRDSRTTS
ncbi:MarR family winged helix-turn-helix transcriptional regulator [Mycobacteroides abscessus]|uniref:MarR family winged helix-turn-helix transcriptional regulator n=1 Tax=Mycobacteroides abscessus TaxID=36809 RepID=UPI00355C5E34